MLHWTIMIYKGSATRKGGRIRDHLLGRRLFELLQFFLELRVFLLQLLVFLLHILVIYTYKFSHVVAQESVAKDWGQTTKLLA